MSNITVTIEFKKSNVVEFAKIFKINKNIKDNVIESLSGIVLLSKSISKKHKLIAHNEHGEWPLQWNLASPNISTKWPHNPHSVYARFVANNLRIRDEYPIKIYLEDDARKRDLVFIIKLQTSEIDNDGITIDSIRDQIISFSGKKNPDEERYIKLRKYLDSVDIHNRDANWFESSVLLNAIFKQKPEVTFRQLKKIKARYTNNISEWQTFIDYLHKLIYPLTITEHGYTIPLSHRDESKVWADIEHLLSVFEKMGIECFINSGTLLGAIRNGALIAHDDDVDLAVVLNGTTFLEAANEWINLKNKLNNMGILNKEFSKKASSHYKIGKAGGASIDLFPAWIIDNQVYIWPHTYGEICTQDLLPLKTITLNNKMVKIPQSPEKILSLNYGATWTIPDSSFKFNWKAAIKKFDIFLNNIKLLESEYSK